MSLHRSLGRSHAQQHHRGGKAMLKVFTAFNISTGENIRQQVCNGPQELVRFQARELPIPLCSNPHPDLSITHILPARSVHNLFARSRNHQAVPTQRCGGVCNRQVEMLLPAVLCPNQFMSNRYNGMANPNRN